MVRTAKKTQIDETGLRYKIKPAKSSIPSGGQLKRACCNCTKPFVVGGGVAKTVMGKPWYFCSQECKDAMFPTRKSS